MHDECPPHILATLQELEALDRDPEVEPEPILFRAVSKGLREEVDWLIKGGASVDPPDGSIFNPLIEACYRGDIQMIDLLIAAGANPCFLNYDGLYILDLVMQSDFSDRLDDKSKKEVVDILLINNACFDESISDMMIDRLKELKILKKFSEELRKFLQSGESYVDKFVLNYFGIKDDLYLVEPNIHHIESLCDDSFGRFPAHYLVSSSLIFTDPKSIENAIFYVLAISRLAEAAVHYHNLDADLLNKQEIASMDDGVSFFDNDNWALTPKNLDGKTPEDLSWDFDSHHGTFGSNMESSCSVLSRAKRREGEFVEHLIKQNKVYALLRQKQSLLLETVGDGKPNQRTSQRGRL